MICLNQELCKRCERNNPTIYVDKCIVIEINREINSNKDNTAYVYVLAPSHLRGIPPPLNRMVRATTGGSTYMFEINKKEPDGYFTFCEIIKEGLIVCPFLTFENNFEDAWKNILLEYSPDNIPRWCSRYFLEQTLFCQEEIKNG